MAELGTATPLAPCPHGCGYVFNRATDMAGSAAPSEGDFSVCLSCGGLCRFGEQLVPRVATEEDERLLTPHQRHLFRIAQRHVRARGRLKSDVAEA